MRAVSLGHAGILINSGEARILCDPWFVPAFFGSWFVFPRNDQLSGDLLAEIESPTHLYISHIHGDHLDETFLAEHVSREVVVLLPDFPSKELERRLTKLGFKNFLKTKNGQETAIDSCTKIAIHVETSITDGPGGDSALVVSDGETRLVNQNDCRTGNLNALIEHGPVDLHWLQYSGAIWYPMVYEDNIETKRKLAKAKVESQFTRALKYVETLNARAVVPSAGPPCFLDESLFHLNVITGDEISIFPDQREFLKRLKQLNRTNDILAIPGTVIDISPESITVNIFGNKKQYLRNYQADWATWLVAEKQHWATSPTDLISTLRVWFDPLMALAPALRKGIGANCLIKTDELDILINFETGTVEKFDTQEFGFRFTVPRDLLETVVRQRAVDWSNSFFLSCRFSAWREGEFNEYLYNFFKSLSVERMQRTESEAASRLKINSDLSEEIQLGDYVMQRKCPHREADLSIFGEINGQELTCSLHGWRFDLNDGHCLNAENRPLRVRRRTN
ncbi:MAG: Rieske 2Fe-2S domain-containing protein [Actinobacteria bacterium]|nr:Rieske 2Fe-2S domain-containing protein [Actinomycetota bacterium]